MIEAKTTVREIAARHPQTLEVFDRHGIDYCCGGAQPLAQAAAHSRVALADLVRELEEAVARPPRQGEEQRDWSAASLSELADHIVSKHHTFMKARLPQLEEILTVVARVHGPAHGDVLQPLQQTFRLLRTDIEVHLDKEECRLFPALRRIEAQVAAGQSAPGGDGEAGQLVAETTAEHDRVGAALHEMRERTSDYAVPKDACPTYMRLYQWLQELEKDVHRHIHLENNILFPRLLELAK